MIDLSYSNVVCLTVNAWICTHVHLPFLSYSINFPPPLALLKLSCSKNTFSSVLWTLIINWGNIWWNVCSRSYTDSFSLSLSVQDAVGRHTSLSLHFKDGRLFCICHSSLRPIRWELCLIEGLWLVNLWPVKDESSIAPLPGDYIHPPNLSATNQIAHLHNWSHQQPHIRSSHQSAGARA